MHRLGPKLPEVHTRCGSMGIAVTKEQKGAGVGFVSVTRRAVVGSSLARQEHPMKDPQVRTCRQSQHGTKRTQLTVLLLAGW